MACVRTRPGSLRPAPSRPRRFRCSARRASGRGTPTRRPPRSAPQPPGRPVLGRVRKPRNPARSASRARGRPRRAPTTSRCRTRRRSSGRPAARCRCSACPEWGQASSAHHEPVQDASAYDRPQFGPVLGGERGQDTARSQTGAHRAPAQDGSAPLFGGRPGHNGSTAGHPAQGPARVPDGQGYGLFGGGPATGAHRAPPEGGSPSNGRPVPPRGESGPHGAPTSETIGSNVGDAASHGVNGTSPDGAVPSQRAGTEASGPSYQQAARRRRADGEGPSSPFGAAGSSAATGGDRRSRRTAGPGPRDGKARSRGGAPRSSAQPSKAVATTTRARRPRHSRYSRRRQATRQRLGGSRRLRARTPRWSRRRAGWAQANLRPTVKPRPGPGGRPAAAKVGTVNPSSNHARDGIGTRSAEDVHLARRACPAGTRCAATLEG